MHRENSTVNPCILMADAPMLNPRSTTAAQTHQTEKVNAKTQRSTKVAELSHMPPLCAEETKFRAATLRSIV